MLGLTPEQTGDLAHAAMLALVLTSCAAFVWLHKHRHTIRGTIRKLLRYL